MKKLHELVKEIQRYMFKVIVYFSIKRSKKFLRLVQSSCSVGPWTQTHLPSCCDKSGCSDCPKEISKLRWKAEQIIECKLLKKGVILRSKLNENNLSLLEEHNLKSIP